MSTDLQSRFDRLLNVTPSKFALTLALWSLLPSVPVQHIPTDAAPFTTYHAPVTLPFTPGILPRVQPSLLPLLALVGAYLIASLLTHAWHRIPQARKHAVREELEPTRPRLILWGLGTLSAFAILLSQVLTTGLGATSQMGPIPHNLWYLAELTTMFLLPFSAVTYYLLGPLSVGIVAGVWLLTNPLHGDLPLFFLANADITAAQGILYLTVLTVEWYLLATAATYLWDELWVKQREGDEAPVEAGP